MKQIEEEEDEDEDEDEEERDEEVAGGRGNEVTSWEDEGEEEEERGEDAEANEVDEEGAPRTKSGRSSAEEATGGEGAGC